MPTMSLVIPIVIESIKQSTIGVAYYKIMGILLVTYTSKTKGLWIIMALLAYEKCNIFFLTQINGIVKSTLMDHLNSKRIIRKSISCDAQLFIIRKCDTKRQDQWS